MRRFFVLMDIRRYDILLSVAVAEKAIGTLKKQPFDLLFVWAYMKTLVVVAVLWQSKCLQTHTQGNNLAWCSWSFRGVLLVTDEAHAVPAPSVGNCPLSFSRSDRCNNA